MSNNNLLKQFGPKESKTVKQYTSAFTPFNSWKFMFHASRVEKILEWLNCIDFWKNNNPELPPPVYVTIDPTNVCNHGCPWCISSLIQENDNTTLSKEILINLYDKLRSYEKLGHKINAIVLAGGGEPLANKGTFDMIKHMHEKMFDGLSNIEYSIITNGELLNEEIARIIAKSASWIGFSVDSGDYESHQKMHAPKRKNVDNFSKIISNIKMINDIKVNIGRYRIVKNQLNVGYKFNIHPDNYRTMIEATKIAKEIGCDQIQFKPTYLDNAFEVMPPIIDEAQENINKARELYEDDKFKVFGVIHKFGPSWQPNHDFGACTMTPLGLIFSADGNMYLCCDRRGEPSLNLGKWVNSSDNKTLDENFFDLWGSEKHKDLIKNINTKDCPRCTFYHYNKTVSEAFIIDNMNKNFL